MLAWVVALTIELHCPGCVEAHPMKDFHDCIVLTPEEAVKEYYRHAFRESPEIEVFRHFKAVVLEHQPERVPWLAFFPMVTDPQFRKELILTPEWHQERQEQVVSLWDDLQF